MGIQRTDFFRKLNNVFFAVVCASTGLKNDANGEEGQKYFENCATGVVLVGKLDIASDNM